MDIEKEILKHTIGAIINECPGIYPKKFHGKYEKRTEYMIGWNAALIEQSKLIVQVLDDLGVHIKDPDFCLDAPIIKIESA